jgi:iron complex transport system substrate-binding protein
MFMKLPTMAFAILMIMSVVLTACAGPSGVSTPTITTVSDYGTRTVTDCTGTVSTFTAAPTRVATITGNVLEILLAMGQKDNIVGMQAVAPNAFPIDLQQLTDSLPKLSGEYVPGSFVPTQREQLLAVNPDFVIGGWPSNFDGTRGAMTQADLSERGINSYFAFSAFCARTAPVTDFSFVYDDIRNFGIILDVEDAAEAMISTMQGTIAEVQAKIDNAEKPKVFSYNFEDGSLGKQAYANGNQHLINATILAAGGENIFADIDAVYQDVSWEEVVARNPDIIVLEVFAKPTQADFDKAAAEAKSFFVNDPALQNITAVKNGNFVVIPAEGYYVGSSRNAESVAFLAKAFHPEKFAE